MTSIITKFEVEVLVKDNPEKVKGFYIQQSGVYRNWEERKMKHIDARTGYQAAKKASKYGKVLSVRKHDPTRGIEHIEHIDFTRTQPEKPDLTKINNIYHEAIVMDEMIWKKRNNRRNNMFKDKKNISL